MPADPRQETGRLGEAAAAGLLTRAGWEIVRQNYRCRYGEIDIVARRDACVIFVEVRARSGPSFGTAEESITAAKAQRMVRCALQYISTHPEPATDWRIDVIAVRVAGGRVAHLEHYPNAVEA